MVTRNNIAYAKTHKTPNPIPPDKPKPTKYKKKIDK